MGVGKDESFIASDVPAIIEYTRDYYLLEHEEIAVLDDNGVQIFDAFGQPVKKELKTADWDVEAIGKGGIVKNKADRAAAIRRVADSAALWRDHCGSLEQTLLCSVIGTHTGPGVVAVAFFKNGV